MFAVHVRSLLRHAIPSIIVGAALPLALGSTAVVDRPLPPPHAWRVQDIAGESPYVGRHCNIATPYYTQPGGKEGEPHIAVDPKNPSRRIAVWMDATRATVNAAYTKNGGRSWYPSIPQGIDGCTGNHSQPWEATGDPWVSYGPDGVAYLSTLTWAHFVTPPAEDYVSVLHVQTSRDGGRTWSRPVFVAGHHPVADKPVVVADPNQAGVAFELWRNQSFGLPVGPRGATKLLFARTANWGRTWTRPIRIASGSPTDFFGSPQLSVLADGTLVATTSLANDEGGTDLLAYRSTNGGDSWSARSVIRSAPGGGMAPLCGQGVAGADTGSSSGQQTVVDGKTVVLVVQDGPAATAGDGRLVESWSRDQGRTWHSSTILNTRQPLLLASVAASRRGTLGLVWDEVSAATVDCTSGVIPARTRFATATIGTAPGPAATVGAPSWNLASGARGTGGFSGYFIGDYQSLAATRNGFTTITVQGEPLSSSGNVPSVDGDTGVMVASISG
jgi:hypothetical protein